MDDAYEPLIGNEFGELVRRLRLTKGWSQSTLATESGLSDGYFSLIETGKRGQAPSSRTLVALADALDCDPEELFRAAGKPMRLADIHRLQANLTRNPEVIRAIQRDQPLRPAEREELIELYNRLTSGR